jgi:predicted ATPase/class 3 adenylate cyclase
MALWTCSASDTSGVVLPSGTITLLFTDIEGSTRLLHELGDRYVEVLADHRRTLRTAVVEHRGVEVDTQGDAFFIAFAKAPDAIAAARAAQAQLAKSPVRVRMGIHSGQPIVTAEGYVGIDVHRGARICAAGHGGQILLSKATRDLLDPAPELKDLGEHRLKDLQTPEWLFQLLAPDLEPRFPPLRSLSNTNLPAGMSNFIGRERELAELGALLRRDDMRLLTLTGPGGTGKTRLAIRLASESVEQFKNGVFFVALAAVTDPARVLATTAHILGAQESPTEDTVDALRRHLERKETLLVLDNFEQVLSAAPELSRLLASLPQLKIVATSRERLRLLGEHEYPISPLPEDDAVTLFDVRARAAKPSFRVELDRASVVAICRRLDGLPLAVELAAARVKLLPPQALFARLEQRLPTLTGGPRDLPERQQTLRATIEWSYLLLDDHEQRLFARLSTFVGGWTPEAAEAVCGATLDDLGSLLDKSLLRRDADLDAVPRFTMLETIRDYALERLDKRGEGAQLARKHAHYFATLAAAVCEGRGHGVARREHYQRSYNEWLQWMSSERDNLVATLAWFVDRRSADSAIELVLNIWRLWFQRGPMRDGQAWTEKVLDLKGAVRSPEFGWFLGCAAEFPRFRGDYARARALEERAVDLLRRKGEGEKGRLASCIEALASIVEHQKDHDLARTLHEESLAIARELADGDRISHALNGLAVLAFREHDYARMESLAEEEVALARKTALRGIPESLGNLAEARRRLGKLDSATELYREALDLSVSMGDSYLVAECLDGLADVAAAGQDFVTATPLWAVSERLIAEADQVPWDPEGTEEGKTQARAALGPERFDRLWQSGQALSENDAVVGAAHIRTVAEPTPAT